MKNVLSHGREKKEVMSCRLGLVLCDCIRVSAERKTAHLKQLENASENLKLFKADILDYDAMAAAIAGCQGVFHVATPVPSGKITDPEVAFSVGYTTTRFLNVRERCQQRVSALFCSYFVLHIYT